MKCIFFVIVFGLLGIVVVVCSVVFEVVFKFEFYCKMVVLCVSVVGYLGLFVFDFVGGIMLLVLVFVKIIGCMLWGCLLGFQMIGNCFDVLCCDNVWISFDGYLFFVLVIVVIDLVLLMVKDVVFVVGLIVLDLFVGRMIIIDLVYW